METKSEKSLFEKLEKWEDFNDEGRKKFLERVYKKYSEFDHYIVMGVNKNNSFSQNLPLVKKHYHELALKIHSDKNANTIYKDTSEELMKLVNAAKAILTDEEKENEYRHSNNSTTSNASYNHSTNFWSGCGTCSSSQENTTASRSTGHNTNNQDGSSTTTTTTTYNQDGSTTTKTTTRNRDGSTSTSTTRVTNGDMFIQKVNNGNHNKGHYGTNVSKPNKTYNKKSTQNNNFFAIGSQEFNRDIKKGEHITSLNGSITIRGDVYGSVNNTNGEIKITGHVHGDVTNIHNRIEIGGNVHGSVKNTTGLNVIGGDVHGSVGNVNGSNIIKGQNYGSVSTLTGSTRYGR